MLMITGANLSDTSTVPSIGTVRRDTEEIRVAIAFVILQAASAALAAAANKPQARCGDKKEEDDEKAIRSGQAE